MDFFKRQKLLISVFLLIMLIAVVHLYPDYKIKQKYNDDWAMYNYGQSIDGEAGKAGIDLNILPVLELKHDYKEVLVAVVDTGVDTESEILQNRMMSGWDFYNRDDSVYDNYIHDYHGTYVSTTIAKIAPNAKILPVKFMESSYGSIEDAVLSIRYAIENGARIINCSWNFNDYDEDLFNIIKDNPDILFVSAAGNSNTNIDKSPLYPSSYELENIINVMAINNNGKIHNTSGYGVKTVDIAAPGVGVKVILPENDITYIDGTSVAAASVSATAALLLSEDSSLSPKEIIEIINSSARKIDSLEHLSKSGGYLDVYTSIIDYLKSE